MKLTEVQKKRIVAWLKSMPWWDDLSFIDLDGDIVQELVEKIKAAIELGKNTPIGSEEEILDDAITDMLSILRDEWSPKVAKLFK